VEWFDPSHEDGRKARTESERQAQEDMAEFLLTHENGIAIWDSTTASKERRAALVRTVSIIMQCNKPLQPPFVANRYFSFECLYVLCVCCGMCR
jgi:hypothetical protein